MASQGTRRMLALDNEEQRTPGTIVWPLSFSGQVFPRVHMGFQSEVSAS